MFRLLLICGAAAEVAGATILDHLGEMALALATRK
jgi:hypothetical protein